MALTLDNNEVWYAIKREVKPKDIVVNTWNLQVDICLWKSVPLIRKIQFSVISFYYNINTFSDEL